jgi:hypothetical protein
MIGLFCFALAVLAPPFKSKLRLQGVRMSAKGRAHLTNNDRWFFIQMYRWFPSILEVLVIIRPETLVHWHRAGFRHYWRWKSRSPGGRPQIETDLRALIRRMSVENPLWGAPRIHGELLKLGFENLRRVLKSYADYYTRVRTHRSLNKDAPVSRPVQRTGVISSRAILGGLHHHYARV